MRSGPRSPWGSRTAPIFASNKNFSPYADGHRNIKRWKTLLEGHINSASCRRCFRIFDFEESVYNTSIGMRCSDGTNAPAGPPPRLAPLPRRLGLPPRLAPQRRRSKRCDGNRHMGHGESQGHNHQQPELSDWSVPGRYRRERHGLGGGNAEKADADGYPKGKKLCHLFPLVAT
jgi:hypothetical protein